VSVRRHLAPELFAPPAYSHAVAVAPGRTVYTAGAVPLAADGTVVGPGDVARQTRQVIENLELALRQTGLGLRDVVKTTVFVVAERREELAEAWRVVRFSPLAGAASTLLGVSLLGYPGQLVEIEAVAAGEGLELEPRHVV
jgi:enamine deaminase RidA (YjgF/YER057c/UK114 family)